MSACALRRWGTGTPCERPADTPAAREMAAKLAAMQAERERQDSIWLEPVVATEPARKESKKSEKGVGGRNSSSGQ